MQLEAAAQAARQEEEGGDVFEVHRGCEEGQAE